MGYNTSMIIVNDALDQIENDPTFGKKVVDAIGNISLVQYYAEQNGRPFHGVDISAGNHCNAATVVETHHADATSVVAFGGNRGLVLSHNMYAYGSEDENVRILRELAGQLGYEIRKKS